MDKAETPEELYDATNRLLVERTPAFDAIAELRRQRTGWVWALRVPREGFRNSVGVAETRAEAVSALTYALADALD